MDLSLFFFCILTCLVSNSICETLGTVCKTPKGLEGRCIVLSSCPSLMDIIEQTMFSIDLAFLQESTCDLTSDEPKACCPLSELNDKIDTMPNPLTTIKPTTTTTTTPPTTTKPPTTTHKPRPFSTLAPIPIKNNNSINSHPNLKLLPSSEHCGISLINQNIVGGKEAGLGHFPWMVLLGFIAEGINTPPQFACGATLISSKYVLTAAHCVSGLPKGFAMKIVRLGEYNQSKEIDCEEGVCAPPVQDMTPKEIILHEDYDKKGKKENDIALIRLERDAILGPFVSPICLPHGERVKKVFSDPIVAGWGRFDPANPEGSQVLQMIKIPFVKNKVCKSLYKDQFDEGRICAGSKLGQDSCLDSGGPLMLPFTAKSVGWNVRTFQFGIVSLGAKDCGKAVPAIYTNVSYFMNWILNHLKP